MNIVKTLLTAKTPNNISFCFSLGTIGVLAF